MYHKLIAKLANAMQIGWAMHGSLFIYIYYLRLQTT